MNKWKIAKARYKLSPPPYPWMVISPNHVRFYLLTFEQAVGAMTVLTAVTSIKDKEDFDWNMSILSNLGCIIKDNYLKKFGGI